VKITLNSFHATSLPVLATKRRPHEMEEVWGSDVSPSIGISGWQTILAILYA